MKKLVIKKGYFFGAGSVFNWTKDGYHIFGVGIARPYFNEKEVEVVVEGIHYTLDMKKAMEFVKKYRAIKIVRGTKIGVISKDLLKPIAKTKADEQFLKDVEWFDNEL